MALQEMEASGPAFTNNYNKDILDKDEPNETQITMRVTKRDGSLETVDLNKIVKAINRCCSGLNDIDVFKIATKTISGLYDKAPTRELDKLSIQTAANLIVEDPNYSKVAARLLSNYVHKEVTNQGIYAFSQSIELGYKEGLINDRVLGFVRKNARKLNDYIDNGKDNEFEYFGIKTVYDRYLLKHPTKRLVIETPQYFFMRIACAVSGENVNEAIELYNLFSSLEYLPGSPTLFNGGMKFEQLSSCFLLDSPEDDLESIYKKYADVAMLSKYSGGIGIAYHRVRSTGSLIKSSNGKAGGVIPFLKTLDSSVACVTQAGRRRGACCVYLEAWHADIEDFLELRNNTGDEARRTYNLNLSNWIPDLFMKRVEEDGIWTLFDPKDVPNLIDSYGEWFEKLYISCEQDNTLIKKQIKARELYGKMMRTLAQTGQGWMSFKDRCNEASNQTGMNGNIIHLSNLCQEIVEVTSKNETAVCNIGSINVSKFLNDDKTFNFSKLAKTVKLVVKQLDRVIDLTYYPIETAKKSNNKWRPVGLGLMGLQDLFFKLNLPFDSEEAKKLSKQLSEEIYFNALSVSCDLAIEKGKHESFDETKAAGGLLQFDFWKDATINNEFRWKLLKDKIVKHGLRNSLLIAIAPTATIGSIAGCYECIEPQISNLFKRETMSGDFLQINKYLVEDLKKLGLWNDTIRDKIKLAEGSIQGLSEIPLTIKQIYRTAWELPMKSIIDMAADRGAFVDQSQSLNLFSESPNIGQLSSMYFYAWKKQLKTTYYLRSRPATKIMKATVSSNNSTKETEAVSCSLENPEACEACQ